MILNPQQFSAYALGDWYCVPASEEEAREIVARAVCNGAEKYHAVRGDGRNWFIKDAWGVLAGSTFTGSVQAANMIPDDDQFLMNCWYSNCAIEYTMEQVREKFPMVDFKRESRK